MEERICFLRFLDSSLDRCGLKESLRRETRAAQHREEMAVSGAEKQHARSRTDGAQADAT